MKKKAASGRLFRCIGRRASAQNSLLKRTPSVRGCANTVYDSSPQVSAAHSENRASSARVLNAFFRNTSIDQLRRSLSTGRQALAKAQPRARKAIIAGMTHPLKKCTGRMRIDQTGAYGDSTLPIDPDLVAVVTQFIRGL